MKGKEIENGIYKGADTRESLYDLTIPETYSGKLVLFVHGYMGFKDWGCWNLVEAYFLNLGFGFCKYNASHNGCNVDDPLNFVDLEAFSMNNYSKECADFKAVISTINQTLQPNPELFVIGHSRGGGIAILTGNHPQVKKVATWAAICDIPSRFPQVEALKNWEATGFYHRLNGRTHQEMPHHFSQYLNYQDNENSLNIESHARNFEKPLLLIQGDADTSVLPIEGEKLAFWSGRELLRIEDAGHTFGSAHPWKEEKMPDQLSEVCRLTAAFFLQSSSMD